MFTKIILFLSLIAITLSAPLKETRKREIIVDRPGSYSSQFVNPWFNERPAVPGFSEETLKKISDQLTHEYFQQLEQELLDERISKYKSKTKPLNSVANIREPSKKLSDIRGQLIINNFILKLMSENQPLNHKIKTEPWLNPYTPPLHRPFKRLQNQFNDQKAGQFPFYLPNY